MTRPEVVVPRASVGVSRNKGDARPAGPSRCGEDVINPDHGEIAELQTDRDEGHGKCDHSEGVIVHEAYARSEKQPNTDDRDEDPTVKRSANMAPKRKQVVARISIAMWPGA